MRRMSYSFFHFNFRQDIYAWRYYLTHIALLEKMQNIGYPEQEGVCHGVACVAAQYFLSHRAEEFNRHLYTLARIRQNGSYPPEQTMQFLDHILIAQHPETYPVLKNTTHVIPQTLSQDLKLAFVAIQNKETTRLGGVLHPYFSNGNYSNQELIRYFHLLRIGLAIFPHRFASVLMTLHHAIMIGFDLEKKRWVLTDSNFLPMRFYETDEQFAQAVQQALENHMNRFAFSAHFLTIGKGKPQSKKFISYCQNHPIWKSLHSVTKRKPKLTALDFQNWLAQVCASGHFTEAKKLIHDAGNLVLPIDFVDILMRVAIDYGHQKIVKLLLQYGARVTDADNSYLTRAVALGYASIVKILLQHGAPAYLGKPAPILIAAEQDRQDIVALLAKHDIRAGGYFKTNARFFNHQSMKEPYALRKEVVNIR